jgi:hypothetical protein
LLEGPRMVVASRALSNTAAFSLLRVGCLEHGDQLRVCTDRRSAAGVSHRAPMMSTVGMPLEPPSWNPIARSPLFRPSLTNEN